MNAALPADDLDQTLKRMGVAAREAAKDLARADKSQRAAALHAMAKSLLAFKDEILTANARDMAAVMKSGASVAFADRLKLSPAAIDSMAKGIETVAWIADPLGDVEA